MIKEIYIFSGLGADERAFQRLIFPGYTPHFIRWIKPEKVESIEDYAQRLTCQISSKQPILIGLSFGGIMAIEVAKHLETHHLILIATAKTKKEIPFYFRLSGVLGVHKLIPSKLMTRPSILANWFFSVSTKEDKKILGQILKDTDPDFFVWAIEKITKWTNTALPYKYTHIHGTADRVLPFSFVSCDVPVKNGGHFMTLDKSDELNKILQKCLESL